jgi:hypothetical protein
MMIHSSEGIVFHDGGALRSRKDIAPIFRFYGEKNYLAMWMKNLQGRTIVRQVLPFLLLYPFRAFCRGGFEGVMGVVSFIKNLRSLLIRRHEVQRLRKVSDKELLPLLEYLLPARIFARDFMIFYKYISRRIKALSPKP